MAVNAPSSGLGGGGGGGGAFHVLTIILPVT